ncbi:hypothetical protein CRG98_041629 [Punica granatum]|uniref:Uncharacterized protein n=1 Tax=Punica granatum TaxID=22663 RepID=A0A2I0I206_PUNGR|nr:hypothetical protein CRG98_041629 [Punica granatum]
MPTCTVKAKGLHGDYKHYKQQELRRTLIPDPLGYVGAPPQSSSLISQDWGIPNEQAIAPALLGLRVHIYCFPNFTFTFTAFRTSCPHLLLSGLRVHVYRFPDFASTFTAFKTSRSRLLPFGLRVHIYCFSNFVSAFTAFWISRPHSMLSGLRVRIYCFLHFASTFTAFQTSRPHLLHSGIHVNGLRAHVYCFLDFASTFTAFRTPHPHLLFFGLRVHIYDFPNFAFTFTAFRILRLHLLLSECLHTRTVFSHTSKTGEQAAMGEAEAVIGTRRGIDAYTRHLYALATSATPDFSRNPRLDLPSGPTPAPDPSLTLGPNPDFLTDEQRTLYDSSRMLSAHAHHPLVITFLLSPLHSPSTSHLSHLISTTLWELLRVACSHTTAPDVAQPFSSSFGSILLSRVLEPLESPEPPLADAEKLSEQPRPIFFPPDVAPFNRVYRDPFGYPAQQLSPVQQPSLAQQPNPVPNGPVRPSSPFRTGSPVWHPTQLTRFAHPPEPGKNPRLSGMIRAPSLNINVFLDRYGMK